MLGPYTANKDRTIEYKGNKIFRPLNDITSVKVTLEEFENRVEQFDSDEMWTHIARINHQINLSANLYFEEIKALFTTLPLTTRMISSSGAVYRKEAINYTTDTCPITLKWFDLPNEVFLSESSQIYLELALMQREVDRVYSIYNSFRKEKSDATHLSEFHHIEFEGKVSQEENEKIALGLIKKIISDLLKKNKEDLIHFLTEEKLKELKNFCQGMFNTPKITFREALDLLYKKTGEDKYKEFK